MTCKDCIGYEFCDSAQRYTEQEIKMLTKDNDVRSCCSFFKSKTDFVEVRHGKWVIKTDYKTPLSHAYVRKEKLYICPYCGKAYRQHMNFCGNCGAKMDGKR